MKSIKDTFKPDPQAIVQGCYGNILYLGVGLIITFVLAQLKIVAKLGLENMDALIAIILYIFIALGIAVVLYYLVKTIRWLYGMLNSKQTTSQAISVEEVLEEIERGDVTPDTKIEGIKQVENSKANQSQRRRAGAVAFKIWESRTAFTDADLHSIAWVGRFKKERPLLESALRLDPNNENYQQEWKRRFPNDPLPK